MRRSLVIGAVGQIGCDLTPALRKRLGAENVVAAERKTPPTPELEAGGPFVFVVAADRAALAEVIDTHDIGTIYHRRR